MFKKIVSFLLSLSVLLCFPACGPSDTGSSAESSKGTTLPDYDEKSEELSVKIAGWVIPAN